MAFYELELGDLAFSLAVRPRRRDGGAPALTAVWSLITPLANDVTRLERACSSQRSRSAADFVRTVAWNAAMISRAFPSSGTPPWIAAKVIVPALESARRIGLPKPVPPRTLSFAPAVVEDNAPSVGSDVIKIELKGANLRVQAAVQARSALSAHPRSARPSRRIALALLSAARLALWTPTALDEPHTGTAPVLYDEFDAGILEPITDGRHNCWNWTSVAGLEVDDRPQADPAHRGEFALGHTEKTTCAAALVGRDVHCPLVPRPAKNCNRASNMLH
jgi:hypothetical protein